MDVLADFAAYQQRRNFSPATIVAHQRVLRRWRRSLAPRSPWEADHRDVEAFLRGGPAYRKWLICTLAGFYRWAIRDGLTGTDPTVKVDRPKLPRRLPRPIGDADLAVALSLATPVLRVLLALAAFAGLRCKEIAGLRWEDVGDESVRVTETKGGDERVVPLHPEIAMALDVLGRAETGPVVADRRWRTLRRHVGRRRISKIGNDYLASLGIAATMHQLRHWFGTGVYGESRDLLLTADLMGHRSLEVTRGYTRVVVDERAAAAVAALSVG